MTSKSVLILITLMLLVPVYGQKERKAIREGVKAYEAGKYSEAEVEFRKAESVNQESYEARFNTGTALYGQEKYLETFEQYENLLSSIDDVDKEAKIWHNIGNSLLEARHYGPSIEAYKNSLRKNPTDDDTRYNLAYAKQKLKEQLKQEQDGNQDQDQDQDKGQQQQDQDKDQQEGQQDQDKDQQQDQQEQGSNEEQQEQQSAPREISKEDAERMLKAIQQQEKDVKEKVDKKKAVAAKVKSEKDW